MTRTQWILILRFMHVVLIHISILGKTDTVEPVDRLIRRELDALTSGSLTNMDELPGR